MSMTAPNPFICIFIFLLKTGFLRDHLSIQYFTFMKAMGEWVGHQRLHVMRQVHSQGYWMDTGNLWPVYWMVIGEPMGWSIW